MKLNTKKIIFTLVAVAVLVSLYLFQRKMVFAKVDLDLADRAGRNDMTRTETMLKIPAGKYMGLIYGDHTDSDGVAGYKVKRGKKTEFLIAQSGEGSKYKIGLI